MMSRNATYFHSCTGRGNVGCCSPPPPPPILGDSDFLGSKREFGQSQLLKTFRSMFFFYYYFEEINIFFFNLKSV